MGIIAFFISLIVLGILYRRMIARDVPEPIGRMQAVVPVLLGVVSAPLSFIFTLTCGYFLSTNGYTPADHSLITQSVVSAFLFAGLTEELAKFLMILASSAIFSRTVRNVYEYTLIGAAVGMGFTLPEEILYGSDLLGLLFRIDFIAGHMIFGILMTYFLGMAKYKKLTAQGSPTREYALALLVPMLMHTLYDTFTANNKFLTDADENIQMIGAGMGIVVALAAFVIQIVILVKHKKNAEKLCSLRLS